jgi:fibronectin type 3 domain-containing protein
MKPAWSYALAGGALAVGVGLHLCCGGGTNNHIVPPPQQGHYVSLAWKASPSSVTGYNVYRASQSGGPFTKLNSAPQSSLTYTDDNVQAGTTYYYAVTAVDSNSVESNFSNEASATVPSP